MITPTRTLIKLAVGVALTGAAFAANASIAAAATGTPVPVPMPISITAPVVTPVVPIVVGQCTMAPTNLTPKASFTEVSVGRVAVVDAGASTVTVGKISSYAWNYGDGFKGTGDLAAHIYRKPGTYTITVTATSHCGTSPAAFTGTASQTVTITAPTRSNRRPARG